MWVPSPGREDLLENGMATHSSILKNPMGRGTWWATALGLQSQTQLKGHSSKKQQGHFKVIWDSMIS